VFDEKEGLHMTVDSVPTPPAAELLRDAPLNWGKWGENDEVGSLNYLDMSTVLNAMSYVRQGKTFTLQVKMASPKGDPVWPNRTSAQRYNTVDKSFWLAGKAENLPGGMEFADDVIISSTQGSTQYDALGHVWYDDQIWNGVDAKTTIGSMSSSSILPIAERGIVGHGILLDMARFRNKDVLEAGETFTHEDLLECAQAQGIAISPRSILLVRTGWLEKYFRSKRRDFYRNYNEPGLTYSLELAQWFQRMEIPNLVTDTIANEVSIDPTNGARLLIHASLMRNLGVTMTEIAWLEDLANDCAADGQYEFLYVAAPLKIVSGTGAPVNPVVIK
jgi:kynurenine formamidase